MHNLAYHNQRVKQSRRDLLGINENPDLEKLIHIPDWIGEGIYRCRVSYKEEIEKIEFFEYHFKHPKTIQFVEDTSITYPYKYEDRSQFQQVLAQNPKTDDVFILHNSYLTDATFANIAFFDGQDWLTPDTPLLKGTKRQYLLDNKILKEATIKVEDLEHFKKLSLINAMRDLNIVYDFTIHINHLVIHGNH
ncbi:aminotransferase class IV [Emticicia sp. C21]|uniref:aminotransferase class IV n=1 Tax=Emticicia sp. C21 TaxID=2302915 RepID=UPI00131428C2|nr:aminotransferase class IV [Emticicia sp. C21]